MIQLALILIGGFTYLFVSGLLKISLVRSREIPVQSLPLTVRKKVQTASKRLGLPLSKLHLKKDKRPYGLHIPNFGEGKICLSTGAARLFSVEELMWILAHEAGHKFLNHSWWHSVYSLVFFGTAFVTANQMDSVLMRIVIMLLLSVIFAYLSIYFQKQFEKQANIFAMTVTGDPQAQISATRVFARFYNTESLKQSWWQRVNSGQLSYAERIKQAKSFSPSSLNDK